VALTLALARRPSLLVLLSSDVLAELERVADYLVLLSRGRVRLAGEVGDLLATHHLTSLEELALNYLRDNPAEVAK
jgi:ABC-2 type transport system ATP-binding protein